MRVSLVDASLSKSIVTLNNEPTTPNLRLSLNAQGADGIDSSGAAGWKKTGNDRDGDQNKSIAVLEIPPVDSPQSAVKVAIAS